MRLTLKIVLLVGLLLSVSACSVKTAQNIARYPLSFFQALIGYVPPPQQTSVLQELRAEHERCTAAGGSEAACMDEAYALVRKLKKIDQPELPQSSSVEVREEPAEPAADPAVSR